MNTCLEKGCCRGGSTMVEIGSKRKRSNNVDIFIIEKLLVEILCRLQCPKTLLSCKGVCKHWYALISQSFFISRFIAYKAGINSTLYAPYKIGLSGYDEIRIEMMNDRTFGLVIRKKVDDTRGELIIRFNDPINDPNNVSVTSGLPRSSNVTVVGACNDLLLYEYYKGPFRSYCGKLQLYIRNVLTGLWLTLPYLDLHQNTYSNIGFICDPYYSSQTTNFTLNDSYSACVVVILFQPSPATYESQAYILSPNTGGMWRNVVLSFPVRCTPTPFCKAFCIGRKVYVHCNPESYIIGFDPFVDSVIINCQSIPRPRRVVCENSFVGVFHERLYMCVRTNDGIYSVWVLEDFETGRWSLRHNIMGQDLISCDPRLVKPVTRLPCFGSPIGFHPGNPDIIYVISSRWIVVCNLSTRKIQIASKLPRKAKGLFRDDGKSYDVIDGGVTPFEISFPAWPTPLPTFAQGGNLSLEKH